MRIVKPTRRAMLMALAGLIGTGLFAPKSFAQASVWPQQPIRIVVPFPAGGNTDTVGRVLAEYLSEDLQVPVIVDNRPGATGIIGTNFVVGQPGDGYTFLLTTISITISPHVYKSMPADIVSHFAPVSMVTAVPKVLVVHPSLPVNSVAELVEYAKKQDKLMTYGSSGVGSAHHLSGELFALHYGIKLEHVPYKGGSPAMNDLMGGQIDMVFDDVPPANPFIQSGRLKALAVSSTERAALLPDVPTIGEAGADGAMVEPWYGVLAPRDTSERIIQAMDAAVGRVVNGKPFQRKILEMGGIPLYKSTSEFSQFIADENDRWGKVAKEANITPQ